MNEGSSSSRKDWEPWREAHEGCRNIGELREVEDWKEAEIEWFADGGRTAGDKPRENAQE